MTRAVVDASVAVKWVTAERFAAHALRVFDESGYLSSNAMLVESNRDKAKSDMQRSEAYAQRWLNAVVRGDAAEMRALSTATSGAAIPTDLERRIVNRLREANVLRSMCPISTIDSKRTISVENALPTTSIVAEAGSISATDPSFSTQISVAPRKFVTRVTMSQEFIEDAIGNGGIGSGLQYVADKCGLSIGLKQEEMYTIGNTGAATPEPEGICSGTVYTALNTISQVTNLGAAAALTTVSGDNLIDTVHLVGPAYRNSPRFSWLISDAFLKAVRKIKVNTTDYVWKVGNEGGITNGAPGTIYGVPYRIGQYVPTTTADTTIYAVVGDFNYFEIFDRTGITTMMDPYSAAATHQTNMYVYSRTDSKLMLPAAFAAIVG